MQLQSQSQTMPPRQSTAGANGPVPKRPRAIAARNAYPRKRAMMACQLCRMRKTKCDNLRPTCGTCTSLSFQCVYQHASTDFSAFDPASIAILDRVNYAIRLLEQQPSSVVACPPDAPRTRHPPETAKSDSPLSASLGETASPSAEYTPLLEAQHIQANCASSRVLQWPSLRDLCGSNEVDKLFFNPSVSVEPPEPAVSSNGRGIREDDVPPLIESFLENVHTKNPILDPNELRKLSRRVGEDGFQWDGASCLILVSCALGTISRPFSSEAAPRPHATSRLDAGDYATCEAYYTAARKRIGLLDASIIAIQCAFLLGVYEMYSMRPLRAWLSFNRACTYFQTYLHSSSFFQSDGLSSETVKSRLYWSCLKSDCEMREEIVLPPTELAKVEYSDAFPSPPGSIPEPDDEHQISLTPTLDINSERSWYYYLSEIASRRIANRITAALHAPSSPEEWKKIPVRNLQRIAEELDAQVVQWMENLPPIFRVNCDDTIDELSYFLRARYLDLRERIWRPFLYLAAHSSLDDIDLPIYVQNASLCLDVIYKHIVNCSVRHRHHGSWFGARNLFTKGLLVLVAAKSHHIGMPSNWMAMMDTCIAGIMYWEDEAPDLRAARLTLQHIYHTVNAVVPALESAF